MGFPAARSLALVVAHPDDDAYGVAGSIALHGDEAGFRYTLVHASYGEAGDIAPGFPATRETLGAIRREECENAWRAHGRVPDRHDWLEYSDGGVAEVPFSELVDRIAGILDDERPLVVATFGPDGITGHPDHVTIGRATDEAFHRVRSRGGPGLQRLVHGAIRESTMLRWNAARIRHGLPPWDPQRVYHLRGVPDYLRDIEVNTTTVAHRIVAGLKQHRSQAHVIFDSNRTDEDWLRSVGREPMIIAWPLRPPDAPRLADIFEGLD
ncbi:PIG-L family deacetylase [Paenarthrobacter sp. Z7-10]|uniref:PIG-L deacetylase family protein n=1 Tax=Paenarthrobacter sp. Z7-10 TaxID=2787635 RepID=UPI0022A94594|nr:PIG-L family deacetylase [Paenarthrobacter sp. Z7-10]MCZ2404628.1 PIG-L family deacetylase [Paenarthrobacter sp. Z7-10]